MALPIKRDDAESMSAISAMLSSVSVLYADPASASYLMSGALGYISKELPMDQKPINQANLESIVSKYGPEVAPSMVNDLLSSAMGYFSGYNLPSDAKSQLKSAFSYISKNAGGSMSDIIVSALNKEAPEYRLDGDIGTPTAATNDNDPETKSSSASCTKVASIMIPVIGTIALLI
ncbi:hypothetical protein EV175_001671 [Coemansia sp. RSA 1933]|nr:hypothetical protein EV175_001671 [Coemansia sp. RSA 1933]